MPALSEIWREIRAEIREGEDDPFATVRRRHMLRLSQLTGNNVVVYATGFVQKPNSGNVSIEDEDVHGFMDVLYKLDTEKGLDLIIHSAGGSVEAAEGIADYLHQHFAERKIRIIVPNLAMSAATMLACAGNSVVMGEHSSLGPIDPQFNVLNDEKSWPVPAYAILQEFKHLRRIGPMFGAGWADAIAEGNSRKMALGFLRQMWPRASAGWAGTVAMRYPLGLLNECRNMTKMCERLARNWLLRRMFRDDPHKMQKADKLARYLANHGHFQSHSRRISLAKAKEMKMEVERLEDDKDIQDAALSVFHALCLTFSHTPISKIIENHNGRRFIQNQ